MSLQIPEPEGPCRQCGRDTWRLDRVMFVGGGFSRTTGYWACINCFEIVVVVSPEKLQQAKNDPP